MMTLKKSPYYLLPFWILIGLVVGLLFGINLGSLAVGVPAGLIMVLWFATIMQRMSSRRRTRI